MAMRQLTLLACVMVVACTEGPEGPEGPQGPPGDPVTADPMTAIANGTAPQDASFHITGLGVLGTGLRVGMSAPIKGATGDVGFQVTSDTKTEAALLTATNVVGDKSVLYFDRTRGTQAQPIDVADGDHLARLEARGYQSGAMRGAGGLRIVVDGPPTAELVPGAIDFITTNRAGTSAVRMRVSSEGNLGIGTSAPTERLEVAGPARIDGVRLFRKTANNGTVSCDTYCQGAQWGNGVGVCFAAKNVTDGVYTTCSAVPGNGHFLECGCAGI
jgi:hypothetical protein